MTKNSNLKWLKTFEEVQSIGVSSLYDTGAGASFNRWKNENPALEFEEGITSDDISSIIKQLVKDFKEEFNCSLYDINNGLCIEFSEELINRLGGYKKDDSIFEMGSDMFFDNNEEASEFWDGELIKTKFGVWSKDMLDKYGYPSSLNKIEYIPHHQWIFYKGKLYDADCPKGVKKWIDLPIYKKFLRKNFK